MKEKTSKRIVDSVFGGIFIIQTIGILVGLFTGDDFSSMEKFISAIQFIFLIYLGLGGMWIAFRFIIIKLFKS